MTRSRCECVPLHGAAQKLLSHCVSVGDKLGNPGSDFWIAGVWALWTGFSSTWPLYAGEASSGKIIYPSLSADSLGNVVLRGHHLSICGDRRATNNLWAAEAVRGPFAIPARLRHPLARECLVGDRALRGGIVILRIGTPCNLPQDHS